ncbi:MAG: hypothetical protein U0Q12_19685 [Vicinamibacterales bacterium]
MPRASYRAAVLSGDLSALARALVLVAAGVVTTAAGAPGAGEPKLARASQTEVMALKKMVDRIVSGVDQPGGDAWLKWSSHFLKGRDGRTYVPFTVTIDDAPAGFDSVVLYVRVVENLPGDRTSNVANLAGVPVGEVPVSVPERQFRRAGEPTAGENSAVLQSLTAKDRKGLPFEDIYPAARASDAAAAPLEPHRIQRALSVKPGRYIVYVAVRERPVKDGKDAPARVATLRREIDVPDFTQTRLQTSSIILADHVEPLPAPLTKDEQRLRPYALGTSEVVPAHETRFSQSQALAVTFFVYNAVEDTTGKPNVTVEYRIYSAGGGTEKLLAQTRPVVLDGTTLPANFSLKAGHQLAPMQSVVLQHLSAGPYRLRIHVVDNVSGEQLFEEAPFIVRDDTSSR